MGLALAPVVPAGLAWFLAVNVAGCTVDYQRGRALQPGGRELQKRIAAGVVKHEKIEPEY